MQRWQREGESNGKGQQQDRSPAPVPSRSFLPSRAHTGSTKRQTAPSMQGDELNSLRWHPCPQILTGASAVRRSTATLSGSAPTHLHERNTPSPKEHYVFLRAWCLVLRKGLHQRLSPILTWERSVHRSTATWSGSAPMHLNEQRTTSSPKEHDVFLGTWRCVLGKGGYTKGLTSPFPCDGRTRSNNYLRDRHRPDSAKQGSIREVRLEAGTREGTRKEKWEHWWSKDRASRVPTLTTPSYRDLRVLRPQGEGATTSCLAKLHLTPVGSGSLESTSESATTSCLAKFHVSLVNTETMPCS